MYDHTEIFLVANPIGRYSIGDRIPGLRTEDGSLTIFMQKDKPEKPGRACQLVANTQRGFPADPAMYEPHESVFDGSYELPPITRRSSSRYPDADELRTRRRPEEATIGQSPTHDRPSKRPGRCRGTEDKSSYGDSLVRWTWASVSKRSRIRASQPVLIA